MGGIWEIGVRAAKQLGSEKALRILRKELARVFHQIKWHLDVCPSGNVFNPLEFTRETITGKRGNHQHLKRHLTPFLLIPSPYSRHTKGGKGNKKGRCESGAPPRHYCRFLLPEPGCRWEAEGRKGLKSHETEVLNRPMWTEPNDWQCPIGMGLSEVSKR